jgi:hypothetical protein
MQSNQNASNADADSRRPSLWQRLDPIWQALIWGAVGGVLVPLVVYLLTPRGSCDDLYLPRLPVDGWATLFLFFFRLVGVLVSSLFLVRALLLRPVDLGCLNAFLAMMVAVWVYYGSTFGFLTTNTYPQVNDQLVFEGQQYVLAFCSNIDLEGGDAALYRCEEEGLRSCYRLNGGAVGMGQTPTLRYEDGSLIVDDMLWEPLVYPLDGGE